MMIETEASIEILAPIDPALPASDLAVAGDGRPDLSTRTTATSGTANMSPRRTRGFSEAPHSGALHRHECDRPLMWR
jgi:hypothetical protein